MNIIECTIKMKEETRTFYEQLAESVRDKELKRLVSLLASAEGEFIHQLEDLKNNPLIAVPADEPLSEDICVFSPHIDVKDLDRVLKRDPDLHAYVSKEENESAEFFDLLETQAHSEQMKTVFRLLAEKEREHMTMVENIYSFIEDPRTYLEWGEFSNMKTL